MSATDQNIQDWGKGREEWNSVLNSADKDNGIQEKQCPTMFNPTKSTSVFFLISFLGSS